MEKSSLAEVWRVLSESIFEEIEGWRREHPTATFQEIEDELDARLSGMRAQMLADLAQQSEKRDWSGQEAEKRPRCPQCGSPLQARGRRTGQAQPDPEGLCSPIVPVHSADRRAKR